VFVRRVVRASQQFRDPEQLRLLFSDDVRAALREAGFDPDTIRVEEIQESEELQRLVADDLRRALRGVLLGRLPSSAHAMRRSPGLGARQTPGLAPGSWSGLGSDASGQPLLPPPTDHRTGPPLRALLALAIAALVAAAIFLTHFQ
jgi:hypothetical protein